MSNAEHVSRAREHLQQHVAFGGVPVVFHEGGTYPHYAERVDGCTFWDVEGRAYTDWFGGGGPCMLGHRHPAVQSAVREQLERGAHLSIPASVEVEVGERLSAMVPNVEQSLLVKNGTDATSGAVRMARAATGRDHVLTNGYHGFQDWSMANAANTAGIPAAVAALSHGFALNDLERVEELMRAIGDEVAAIVVAPVQDVVADTSFLRALRELADRHGSWLVFDEVVTGFRMARGGMQELTGVPADVVCLGKALGNGFPIAAVAGPRRSMRHLRTFRYGMTAQRDALSLAAANACLQVYEREDVPAHLARIGARLRERFVAAVDEHGVDWQLTGAPQWPHLKVGPHGGLTADAVLALVFETAQRRGIYLSSPRIWSCYAHREADADALADALAAAMALTREAGERGLPDFVERPVYQRLDRNHERAREERTWRDEPIASPFSTLAGTVTLSGAVRGHEANAALHEGGVRLSLGSCQGDRRPNGTATCAVFGNRPVAGDCRVLASYEIRVAELRNATVECVLAINDVEGGGHRSVSNAWSLVLGAWLHVAAKARRHRTPSYQHPEGATLVMERRSGAWHAELRSGTMTLRLPVPGGPHEGPFRAAFRVRSTGALEELVVDLTDLRIEPLDPHEQTEARRDT